MGHVTIRHTNTRQSLLSFPVLGCLAVSILLCWSSSSSSCTFSDAFSGQPQSSKNPVRVLVTGAAGKTGRIVMSKLEEDHRYEPKGLFRTEQSARKIVKNVDTKCPLEHVVIADVTSPTFLDDLSSSSPASLSSSSTTSTPPLAVEDKNSNDADADVLQPNDESSSNTRSSSKNNSNNNNNNGLENMDAMIICTSAVPRIRKRSLAAMLVKAPWRALRGKPVMNIRSMRFAWKYGGYPEKVDYNGQKAQIDLAKRLGIPHVVLISSMGGTDPDNFLNSVGKQKLANGNREGHGDILMWKRMAEKYLVESGLDYTILHPGGLVDTPGGQDDFVFGVDDHLYEINHHHHHNTVSTPTTTANATKQQPAAQIRISREDTAELCVAALSAGKGKKVSFDCITIPPATLSSLVTDSQGAIGDASPSSFLSPGMGISAALEEATAKSKTMTTTTTTSATAIATTTIPAETTANGRQKSAEDALCEFFDLSVTTNYHLDLDDKE